MEDGILVEEGALRVPTKRGPLKGKVQFPFEETLHWDLSAVKWEHPGSQNLDRAMRKSAIEALKLDNATHVTSLQWTFDPKDTRRFYFEVSVYAVMPADDVPEMK